MTPSRDPHPPTIHLETGGLMVTTEHRWISTILGSCVAITMFHRPSGIAAICHSMLPRPRHESPEYEPALPPHARGRFVSTAVSEMTEVFRLQQLKPHHIEVKLFGGANVLHAGPSHPGEPWIGTANVSAARLALQSAGFHILAENVGGHRGCKILFNTATGEVLHRPLASHHERIR